MQTIKKLIPILLILLLTTQLLAGQQPFSATAQTTTPIKHVVVIMMENHSFDNIFGLYPTMNNTNYNPLMASLEAPDDVLNVTQNVTLKQVPNGTYWTSNPDETVYSQDWNNGKMNGFATHSGIQSMTYYSSSQLGVEWDWAEEYAIADRYFSSCLCETNPNRLFSLAGYAAGLTGDDGPPPYISVNQTIFSELNQYGISWAYYLENPVANDFPLDYFSGMNTYTQSIKSWSDFESSLQDGLLPTVSWVMPVGGGAYGVDQHPINNITDGQSWLLNIVNNIMASPYWNSTAIFITYDEGGGYYDQVPPPKTDGVQLGFRVPLFVISPYSKENYVSDTVMNHASILAFIDYNWHLPALNEFVASSGLPIDMFDFQGPVREPLLLTPTSKFPINPQIPFSQLMYSRHGLSSQTIGSSNKLFVDKNLSSTPFNYAGLLVASVIIVIVGSLVAVGYLRAFSRRRS